MNILLIIVLILSVTSCASSRGFDRGNLRGQFTDQKIVTEKDIKKALELKPQLPNPFKLAIYFSTPNSEWRYRYAWNWLGEDKDKLLEIKNDLKPKNIISDVIVINDSIVEGTHNKAIRLAAARVGADAVVVINGVSDVDRYNNNLGFAYFLLITPFFIPGTEADALFMTNASMWDVRNQYLYLSVETEGMANEAKPAFYIDEDRVIKAANQKLLPL